MVCDSDCDLYTINAFVMLEILSHYKQIYATMKKVSYIKQNYYTMLQEQISHKYNDKFKVVGLYNDLKDYEFTLHQGLKRRKNKI